MKGKLTDSEKGYAVYTRRNLSFYDRLVPGFLNPVVWKCPTEEILTLYRSHISINHLEVGVGTGYYLEKTLPEAEVRLGLLDANRDCLDFAAARVERFKPELHQENVLEPFELSVPGFDSMAVNYLFHCLPGRLEDKAGRALDHLAPYLHEQGTIFGSTVLGTDIQIPRVSRMIMRWLNRKGILSNGNDSLGAMMEVLSSRFKTFNVEVHGSVVLFWGRGLRDGYRKRLKGLVE